MCVSFAVRLYEAKVWSNYASFIGDYIAHCAHILSWAKNVLNDAISRLIGLVPLTHSD